LKNIKAHESTTINLEPGLNIIVGPNGCGKSSIIEALGLAIFDTLPYKQRNFIRRGQEKGKIEVIFDDFKVTREVPGAWTIGDLTYKEDVVSWICRKFRAKDLSIVARLHLIQQFQLHTPFLKTPAQRRAYFEDILGISDYEEIWKAIGENMKVNENHKDELEKKNRMRTDIENQIAQVEYELDECLQVLNIVTQEYEVAQEEHEVARAKYDEFLLKQRLLDKKDVIQSRVKELGVRIADTEALDKDEISRAIEYMQMKQKLEKISDLESIRKPTDPTETASLEDRIRELEVEIKINSCDSICPILGEECGRIKGTQADVEELISEQDRLKRELFRINQENKQKLVQLQKWQLATSEIAVLKSEIKHVEEPRANLKNFTLIQLEKELDKAVEAEITKASLLQERIKAISDLDEITKKLSEMNPPSDAETKLRDAQQKKQEVWGQLKAAEVKVNNLKSRLKSLNQKLTDAEDVRDELKEVANKIIYSQKLRSKVRDFEPTLSRTIRSQTSSEASNLVRQFGFGEEIIWDESYNVILDGKEYPLLSGGEKVATALCLYLALAKRVSKVDFFVIDEPLMGLDDVRVEEITEIFGKLSTERQVIVVTHNPELTRYGNIIDLGHFENDQ